MLRNCVDADSVEDPVPAVQAMIERCSTESLMMTYSIPAFPKGDVMMFLAMIAKRNGRVLKGGIPDKVMAARLVIRDWNSGKIPYFTRPPSIKEVNTAIVANDAKILDGFSKEFDVSKIDEEVMKSLEQKDELDFVQMEADTTTEEADEDMGTSSAVAFLTGKSGDEDDEDMDMDEDDDDEEGVSSTKTSRMKANNSMAADAEDYDFGAM